MAKNLGLGGGGGSGGSGSDERRTDVRRTPRAAREGEGGGEQEKALEEQLD